MGRGFYIAPFTRQQTTIATVASSMEEGTPRKVKDKTRFDLDEIILGKTGDFRFSRVYFFDTLPDGNRVFGDTSHSATFEIPNQVYELFGSPNADKIISIRKVILAYAQAYPKSALPNIT